MSYRAGFVTTTNAREVADGERFKFGENWTRFLEVLDDERIAVAEASLTTKLGRASLAGLSFLDVGSGSGLFSLAARRLGATVTSFDYDPHSVACTRELQRRYFPDDPQWRVLEGSALDAQLLDSLGRFDVVYSWGVLHHTGAMWDALALVGDRVAPRGQLFIALYNDQGRRSKAWLAVKRTYCSGPVGRAAVLGTFVPYFVGRAVLADLAARRNPVARWREYRQRRGMSMMHDIVDWVGGLPFEVANPGDVHDFFRARGFTLELLKTVGGGHGCNELVLRRA